MEVVLNNVAISIIYLLIFPQADLAPDTRSGEQQTQDLFKQCQEEVEIDSKIKRPEDDIAERLNRLRNPSDVSKEVGLCLHHQIEYKVLLLNHPQKLFNLNFFRKWCIQVKQTKI